MSWFVKFISFCCLICHQECITDKRYRSLTLRRGKVVRSDFIAGNEHWTKAETQLNGLKISDV